MMARANRTANAALRCHTITLRFQANRVSQLLFKKITAHAEAWGRNTPSWLVFHVLGVIYGTCRPSPEWAHLQFAGAFQSQAERHAKQLLDDVADIESAIRWKRMELRQAKRNLRENRALARRAGSGITSTSADEGRRGLHLVKKEG